MKESIRDELSDILEDYNSLPEFVRNYGDITIPEFDYYTVNKLSLFLVHENYDFNALRQILDKIDYALPSIKRIFQKPIIHLKEEDELVPIEAVKLVNNTTINHISTHSELWDDITEEGIKPLKLLTRTYRDNYNIYENQVFARTIDCILSYLRKNMRFLKTLMYSNSNLQFNLLERVNHLDYFLAIGKLHTGYIRNFSRSYDDSKDCYNRMNSVYEQIMSRRKRNVYRLNRHYGHFQLHNSNILLMQKDYHRVYVLLKKFKEIKQEPILLEKKDILDFNKNYLHFCKIITVFSILHMNFTGRKDTRVNLKNLDAFFEFQEFILECKEEDGGLALHFKEDSTYDILLVPYQVPLEGEEFTIDREKLSKKYNDIFMMSPLETVLEDLPGVLVSITDIDSFRRIGRIIEKGMVYANEDFKTCFFCGGDKIKNVNTEDEPVYICNGCRTKMIGCTCDQTKKKYFVTTIDGFTPQIREVMDNSELYHYRNITDVTKEGDFICPHCNAVHRMRYL